MPKTIVENSTGLSKFLFADDVFVFMGVDNGNAVDAQIVVGHDPVRFRIGDNSLLLGKATLYENVTNVPHDWYGNAYTFDGTTWEAVPGAFNPGTGGIPASENDSSNVPPSANNDTATVVPGQPTTINIGANDTDANNDELTTSGLTSPRLGSTSGLTSSSKGTVFYNNNTGSPDTVTYTGFANSSGTDSFVYVVSDGNGGADHATVTVTFQNGPPDTEAPRLQSVAVNTSSVITNKQVTISYGATDNQTGVDNVNFYWTDITGVNQRIARTSFATEDTSPTDGTHTFTIPDSVGPGQYFLSKIDLRDHTGNLIEYFRGGALDDNITDGDLPNHNLESSFLSGDFTLQGVSDLEAPRLASFNVDTTVGQAAKNQVGVSLFATDDSGRIPLITLSWTDITGINQRFAPIAFTGTREGAAQGNIHIDFTIPNSVEPGEYFLSRIDLTDGANNTISYFRGGALDDNISSGDLPNHTLGGSFTSIQSNVTVVASNSVPVANNDTAKASAGSPVVIEIGANDSDPENEELTTVGLTPPSKGTVEYTENLGSPDTARYTVNPGQTGTDNFTYKVVDESGKSDTANVTITIENASPVANDDSIHISDPTSNTTIVIGANDSDPDNDPIATTSLTQPTKGTVQYTDNLRSPDAVTYRPKANASGIDSFTYRVSDGNGGTDTATVTVSFENAPPVALDDTANAFSGQPVTIVIGANDSDPNNDQLQSTGLTSPSKGIVEYNENANTPDSVIYTPNPGASGVDSFTYRVSDGNGGTDTATVTVSFQNAPPVALDDSVVAISIEPITIIVGANDSDPNNDQLQTTGLTSPSKGTARYIEDVNGPDSIIYTPNLNANGVDRFTYQVSDGRGGTDTATVTVSFENTNPIAQNDRITLPSGATASTIIQIGANDSDPDNDEISTRLLTNPSKGIVEIQDKKGLPDTAIYTPHQNASKSDSFTYQISDGKGGVDTATVSIFFENDDPIAENDTAIVRDLLPNVISIGDNDTDANGDELTSTILTQPQKGNIQYRENEGAPDIVVYTANRGVSGTDSFEYKVDDGKGGSDTATVTIILENSPPNAGDDEATSTVGTTINISIGSNDSDPNADPLTYSTVSAPEKGTVSYPIPGVASYTPFSSASGSDSFAYMVSDGRGGNDEASVFITFANAEPIANDDVATTSPGRPVNIVVGANDRDPNSNDELTTAAITQPGKGTIQLIENIGSPDEFLYTPDLRTSGRDSFTYRVDDGNGGSDTANVTITIKGTPSAADDTFSAVAGQEVVLEVGLNDTHPENTELTTSIISEPRQGTARVNENIGSFDTITYTPDVTAKGTDTIVYQVSDPNGSVDTATVSITFNNRLPEAQDDTAEVEVGKSIVIRIGDNDSDPDGDPLSTTAVIQPSKGSVIYTENDGSADTLTYTPFTTARGVDTFSYEVNDGRGGVDAATVTVNIKTLQNAIWNNVTYSGFPSVGQTITTNQSFTDPDGDSDNIIYNQFSLIDDFGTKTIVGQAATALPSNAVHKWETNQISYSFNLGNYQHYNTFGWLPFSTSDQSRAKNSIEAWRRDTDFSFIETDGTDPDLVIGYDPMAEQTTGSADVLGYFQISEQDFSLSTDPNLIEPHFGEKGILAINPNASKSFFDLTMLHELGHAIGLGHREDQPSLMNPFANSPNFRPTIQPADVETTRNLYPENAADAPLSFESVILTSDMIGKTLVVQKGFYDDSGVFEISPEYTIGIISGSADVPDDFSTSAQLILGESLIGDHSNINGTIDLRDVFKVELKKGGTYVFQIKGAATSSGTLLIPYGELYDPNQTLVAGDFASGRSSANSIATDAFFSYTVHDEPTGPYYFASVGGSNFFETGTYSISVDALNTKPNANNDRYTSIPGQTIELEVLRNDIDPDDHALSFVELGSPTKGSVSIHPGGNTLIYTAFPTATGSDSFTYEISDGFGGNDIGIVTIDLGAKDSEPLRSDDAPETFGFTTYGFRGNSVNGVLNGFGFDSSDYWYIGEVDIGSKLEIEFQSSLPPSTAVGSSIIGGLTNPTLRLHDATGTIAASDFGTIGKVETVVPAKQDYWVSIEKLGLLPNHYRGYTLTKSISKADIAGDASTTALITAGKTIFSEHTINDFGDLFSFSALAGKTYLIDLEGSSTNAGTLSDPFLAILASDGETVLLSDDDTGFGNNAQLLVFANETQDVFLGSFSVASNGAPTGTYKLSVSETNTAPIANADTGTVKAGQTVRITVGENDSDPDGDLLTTSGLTSPTKGTVSYHEYTHFYDFIEYTADVGTSGTDSFEYQVSDGKGGNASTTVTITIAGPEDEEIASGQNVFRFLNTQTGSHLYTTDENEANIIIETMPHFSLEGPAFKAADATIGDVSDVFRFFNTQTGVHFYTQSALERDSIIENLPNFNFENSAYSAYENQNKASVPLYRFFNTNNGSHFYSASEIEKDHVLENFPSFNFEGVAYYVDESQASSFSTPSDSNGVFSSVNSADQTTAITLSLNSSELDALI